MRIGDFREIIDDNEDDEPVISDGRELTESPFTPEERIQIVKEYIENKESESIDEETASHTESIEEYEYLLSRHPYAKDTTDFDRKDGDVKKYFEAKRIRSEEPSLKLSEISRRIGTPDRTLREWNAGRKRPILFRTLASHEFHRQRKESRMSPEALSFRVDPSTIYKHFKPTRHNFSIDEVVTSLETISKDNLTSKPILFLDFRPYNRKRGPLWFREMGEYVENNLSEIELKLANLLEYRDLDIRVGYVDRKLYILKRTQPKFDLFSLLRNEIFYFDKDDRDSLIDNLLGTLDLKHTKHLGKLLDQLTDRKDGHVRDFSADMDYRNCILYGKTLQIMMDVTEVSLSSLTPLMRGIGRMYQIESPRILHDTEFLENLTRLYAIIASDGSISDDYSVIYSESNFDRREIVKDFLSRFGKVAISDYVHQGRIIGIRLPCIFGRILNEIGMPVGDKGLQGLRLPEFIREGNIDIIIAYLQEVIPEDGYISLRNNRSVVGINRSITLLEPSRYEKYTFSQKITDIHVRIIREFGTQGDFESRVLPIGRLKDLCEHKDSSISIAATELLDIALQNPVLLLNDEHRLVSRAGIVCPPPTLQSINLREKTGRISAIWNLSVSGRDAIARWALLALPNDIEKREKFLKWKEMNPDEISKAYEKLRSEGLIK